MLGLIVCALLSGGGDRAAAEADLLEAAGCVRATRDFAAPAREGLRYPHFLDLSWTVPNTAAGAIQFLPLDGCETWLRTAAAEVDGYAVWRRQCSSPSWNTDGAELSLAQVGATALARGTLRLTRPRHARAERVVLLEVLSGCSMTLDTALPLELDDTPRELVFGWDLHSPVALDGLCLSLVADGVALPPVPITLRAPRSPLRVKPTAFETPGSGQTFELVADAAAGARLISAVCPPCVHVADSAELGPHLTLRLEPTPIAELYHRCSAVLVEVAVEGDPVPFTRRIDVRHGGEGGLGVVAGVFAPGETIELWSLADRTPAIAHPDRLPCSASLLALPGCKRIGAVRAPDGAGPWRTELPGLRLSGRVDPAAWSSAQRWFDLCAP